MFENIALVCIVIAASAYLAVQAKKAWQRVQRMSGSSPKASKDQASGCSSCRK